jgi:Glycosyltransferase family 87
VSWDRVKALAAVVLILGWLGSVFYIYSRPARNGFGPEHDFVTVIAGTHCLITGCDPYDAETLEKEFPARMGGYVPTEHFKPEWPVYPPSTFVLLFPFSLLPWKVLAVIWLSLTFAFLAAAFVVLCLRFQAYRNLLSFLPFIILLSDGSIGWAVQLGQPALMAASALTMAIIALESGTLLIPGGLLLAFSLCLKPQGAYLCGLYFLLRRKTRIPAVAAYLFTAAAAAAGAWFFRLRLGSYAYLDHLSANLKLAMQPGRDADFSRVNDANSSSFLNLQAFLARLFEDPHLCNLITYATVGLLIVLLIYVCVRSQTFETRPFTIVAVLVMLELLVSYHRLYDHALMLAAIPGLYEMRKANWFFYVLFVFGLVVYHFSQFHGMTIHGLGPFPSGAPVELFISAICLYSLWAERPLDPLD